MSFALHISKNRLVIRAKQTREHDEDVLELIPHTVLAQDIPTLLVEGHAHWLNLRTHCLEFRPLVSLWTSSPANWRLHFTERSKMIFGGSSELLIDTHSPTFEMLSQRLQPLEPPKFLLIRYAKNSDRLSVQLPRLGLSFTLNSGGDLESQNIPRMVVDTNQSSGTLFGLRSQLILRETGGDLPSRSRCVIIPQGKVHFALEGNHPVVTIDTKGSNRVVYHQYKINTDLRYLEGNVSLASKLFKIYLHAVCSHCLSDPLTGRTGTAEALRELRSAGCISFQTLSPPEARNLELLCALTPGRSFSRDHLKVAQTIAWTDLSPLSQHRDFHTITHQISEYAKSMLIFQQSSTTCNMPDGWSDFLLDRGAQRNSVYYFADPSVYSLLSSEDHVYSSGSDIDAGSSISEEESEVCRTSYMVQLWSPDTSLGPYVETLLVNLGSRLDIASGDYLSSLSYNCDWLSPILSKAWVSLYNLCRSVTSDQSRKKYRLTFSLSAMAYGSPQLRDLIPALLAFATTPLQERPGDLDPPSHPSYTLSDGFEPDKARVCDEIISTAHSLINSPSELLQPDVHENLDTLEQRRRIHYQNNIHRHAASIVAGLMQQWPCTAPCFPSSDANDDDWFDIQDSITKVHRLFHSCFMNQTLRDHLERVENTVLTHRTHPLTIAINIYSFTPSTPRSPIPALDGCITLQNLLGHRDFPDMEPQRSEFWAYFVGSERPDGPADRTHLQTLISALRCTQNDGLHRQYGQDLEDSLGDLRDQVYRGSPHSIPLTTIQVLCHYRDQCKERMRKIFTAIFNSLSPLPSKPIEHIMEIAGLWPEITPRSILSMLAFSHRRGLTRDWMKTIAIFAQTVIEYQRSHRLVRFALTKEVESFYKESANASFDWENALHYPDWVLIQVILQSL